MVEFIAKKVDRINQAIRTGADAVRGGARWLARDWHWLQMGGPAGLLLTAAWQKDNISQAAIQAWQVLNPVRPIHKVIDPPQEQLVRAEPINTPLAEATPYPTPQGPAEPEGKAGTGPNPPDENPEKAQPKDDSSKEKPDNLPELEPTPKPLPDIVNEQNEEFAIYSFADAEKMFEESVQKGDPKIPVIKGVEYRTLRNKNILLMGLYAQPGQTIDMPPLVSGEVIQAEGSIIEAGATANVITIRNKNGIDIVYYYPSGSKWNVKVGDQITSEDKKRFLFSTTFKPNSEAQQAFEDGDAWMKGAAVMVQVAIGNRPIGKGTESILIDVQDAIVAINASS